MDHGPNAVECSGPLHDSLTHQCALGIIQCLESIHNPPARVRLQQLTCTQTVTEPFFRILQKNITGSMTATTSTESLKGAKEEIKKLISSTSCGPILMRLAWHDAGTYEAVRPFFFCWMSSQSSRLEAAKIALYAFETPCLLAAPSLRVQVCR